MKLINSVFLDVFTENKDLYTVPVRLEKFGTDAATVVNRPVYMAVKRSADIVASLCALIVLLIRMEFPGPAIFTQKRMGKGGKPFVMYKFRTMRMDAPPELATRDFVDADEYITKVGAVLRRTSLDELPQLLNVLMGDMSLVGYRPICLTETDVNDLRMRCGVFVLKPGITGLAQVSGRDNISVEEKVQLDAKYVCECSIKMDLWCLIMMVAVVFTGEGVT